MNAPGANVVLSSRAIVWISSGAGVTGGAGWTTGGAAGAGAGVAGAAGGAAGSAAVGDSGGAG